MQTEDASAAGIDSNDFEQPEEHTVSDHLRGLPEEAQNFFRAKRRRATKQDEYYFGLWCEIHAVEGRIRERELLKASSHADIDARDAALTSLRSELSRLNGLMNDSSSYDGNAMQKPVVEAGGGEAQDHDVSTLATRDQLIEAFGRYTGMRAEWFRNLKDAPKLLAARKVAGQGGRGHIKEPLFCPFEVMQWLADSRRRKGRKLSEEKAWELLEKNFPKAYSMRSVADPRAGD